MQAFHQQVGGQLPGLTAANHRETSPASWEYNCVAWAVGSIGASWWPVPGRFWPEKAPREETLAAFENPVPVCRHHLRSRRSSRH